MNSFYVQVSHFSTNEPGSLSTDLGFTSSVLDAEHLDEISPSNQKSINHDYKLIEQFQKDGGVSNDAVSVLESILGSTPEDDSARHYIFFNPAHSPSPRRNPGVNKADGHPDRAPHCTGALCCLSPESCSHFTSSAQSQGQVLKGQFGYRVFGEKLQINNSFLRSPCRAPAQNAHTRPNPYRLGIRQSILLTAKCRGNKVNL